MPDATPYGGSEWIAQAASAYGQSAQAMLQQLALWLQQQMATGYVQQNPLQAPTSREQAMMSIWNARKDIRDMYEQWWGKDVDPIQAIENWTTITTEEGAKDPIAFATNAGYVKPSAPGQMVPTLEREQMGINADLQWRQLAESYRKNPSDWLSYSNWIRGGTPGQVPAWAQAAMGGQGLPSFNAPATQSQAAYGGAGANNGVPTAPSTNWMDSLAVNPQQFTPQMMANMLPSEFGMLQGVVENQRGYMPDFLQMMQKSWPTGSAGKRTIWG